eukprot:5221888-Prymnesium_polylepis.1
MGRAGTGFVCSCVGPRSRRSRVPHACHCSRAASSQPVRRTHTLLDLCVLDHTWPRRVCCASPTRAPSACRAP